MHGAEQRLGLARWRHPHWVTCILVYKDWRRKVMQPNNYTELFFLDEATALAAGHRPCALCRRKDYVAFQEALCDALHREDSLGADGLDRMLHSARISEGTRHQKRFEAVLDNVPSGAMIRFQGDLEQAWLVKDDQLLRWQPEGYDAVEERSMGKLVDVLTPRPSVLALQRGYQPFLHPSAEALLLA
ncbi:MAG: hypothetical protein ACR2QH_03690 [Geminicoccaceae bacterium]